MSPPSVRVAPAVTVANAVLLGASASLLAALADVASTVLWLSTARDQLRLVFVLAALGLFTGAVAGALVGGAHALLARVVRAPVARHAVVVAVPLALVAHWLFAGGKMRRLPAQWLLQPAAAVALIALAALALTRATATVRLLRSLSPTRRALVAAGFFALAWALHGLDHRVLPRLYEYLHAALGVLTALAFAGGLAVALRAPRRPVAAAAATLALALPLGAAAWAKMDAWANVRAEVFGTHAPFVHHAVFAVEVARGSREVRPADPVALRRARFARARAAPAAPGALPVARGAHVLLVTIDALRADRLGRTVNGRALTPTLDALARGGVVFERAYTQAPHSSYSLSSLHTSEYLHETIPLGQPQPRPTLADALGAAGYATVGLYTNGIFFTEGERLMVYRDRHYGFARASHTDRSARDLVLAARGELDALARRGEPPSFLWLHFFDAHAPYQGSGPTALAQYDGAVAEVDRQLGQLLDHARTVLARDLVVAVTADHGEEFHEHGGVYHGSTLFEEQVRVPLVVAAPGVAPRRVQAPVELIDLAPTLAALAGVAAPRSFRGRDLRPRMAGDEAAVPVFSSVNTRKMVVRWPYKLIADLAHDVDELFDLARDPGERRNLVESRRDLRTELHAELQVWMETLARGQESLGPLARARMGDRHVIPDLVALARDPRRPPPDRVEAVALLAGFASPSLVPDLRPLLADRDPSITGAAAIALGAAGDDRARDRLVSLLGADPPATRHAAALALAKLGDARAVDTLTEALWSPDEELVLKALIALGELGDRAALEPLLQRLPDDHVRYRVALVLGQLRDPRAFDALVDLARNDPTDDARANAVAALGMLGDRRAVPVLAAMISRDRAPPYAAEALCALGALGRELDGWAARAPDALGHAGFARCARHDDALGWRYLDPRSCSTTEGATATVTFRSRRAGPRLLVVRLRRADDGPPVPVALRVGGRERARVTADGRWDEPRVALDDLPAGDVTLAFEPTAHARVRVDHVLALPLR